MFLYAKKQFLGAFLMTLAGASIITICTMFEEKHVISAEEKTAISITTNASSINVGDEFDVFVNVHSKYDNKMWMSNDVKLLSNAYDKLSFVSSSILNENENIESVMGSNISYTNNYYLCGLLCYDPTFTTNEDIVYKVTFKLVANLEEDLSFYVDATKINIKYSDGSKEEKESMELSNTVNDLLTVEVEQMETCPIILTYQTETRTPYIENDYKSYVSISSETIDINAGSEFDLYVTASSKFNNKTWFAQQVKICSDDFDKVSLVSASIKDKVNGEEALFGSGIVGNSYLCSVVFNQGNTLTSNDITYVLSFKVKDDVEIGSSIGFYIDKSSVSFFYGDNSKESKKDVEVRETLGNQHSFDVVAEPIVKIENYTFEVDETNTFGETKIASFDNSKINSDDLTIYIDDINYEEQTEFVKEIDINDEYIYDGEIEYIEEYFYDEEIELFDMDENDAIVDATESQENSYTKTNKVTTSVKNNNKKSNSNNIPSLIALIAILVAGGTLISICKYKLKLF